MNDSFYVRVRSQIRNSVQRNKGRTVAARFDTSDVIQEAMIQVWNDIEKSELSDVIFPEALINCIGRGHSAKMTRFHSAAKRSVAREKLAVPEHHFSRDSSPSSEVEKVEAVSLIRDAIRQLAPIQKYVLYRRVFEDATFFEIGNDLDYSSQKTRRVYYRAIRKVQSMIGSVSGL